MLVLLSNAALSHTEAPSSTGLSSSHLFSDTRNSLSASQCLCPLSSAQRPVSLPVCTHTQFLPWLHLPLPFSPAPEGQPPHCCCCCFFSCAAHTQLLSLHCCCPSHCCSPPLLSSSHCVCPLLVFLPFFAPLRLCSPFRPCASLPCFCCFFLLHPAPAPRAARGHGCRASAARHST